MDLLTESGAVFTAIDHIMVGDNCKYDRGGIFHELASARASNVTAAMCRHALVVDACGMRFQSQPKPIFLREKCDQPTIVVIRRQCLALTGIE